MQKEGRKRRGRNWFMVNKILLVNPDLQQTGRWGRKQIQVEEGEK